MVKRKTDDTPNGLRVFNFHGLDITHKKGEKEATCDCPFCGREGKLGIRVDEGLWNCFGCDEGGNPITFIRKLWEASYEATQIEDYKALARERGLMNADSLVQWHLAKSIINDRWMVPGYNESGNINQLYVYRKTKERTAWFASPGMGHHLFGRNLFNEAHSEVYVVEGLWDGVALWEVLRETKHKKGDAELISAKSPGSSLAASASVLALPSANTFQDQWGMLLVGKNVYLMGHNDHPRTHPKTGKEIEPASLKGMKKVAGLIGSEVEELQWLKWGENGSIHDPELKSGYDIRDSLKTARGRTSLRLRRFQGILDRLEGVPQEWITEQTTQPERGNIPTVECETWKDVRNSWKRALKWIDGLDITLSVMLASIVSTQNRGDQLWIKVIGPPSCGKSTLAEAIAVAGKYVRSLSLMTGFHSGWKNEDGADTSLISELYGKTLLLKDADTLLSSDNYMRIMSEARDIYDGSSRVHYRNSEAKEYQGMRMTWLICGTATLRNIDESQLGERFLDCVVMESIEEELEEDVLDRIGRRVSNEMGQEAEDDPNKRHSPELTKAMQLTGGYVEWLRRHAMKKLSEVEMSDERLTQCKKLAQFVSYMRTKPSQRKEEAKIRELPGRIMSQLVRLAKSLAVVLNRSEVDDEVMRRVVKVGLDTSWGASLDVVQELYPTEIGRTIESLTTSIHKTKDWGGKYLLFMSQIGIVQNNKTISKRKGIGGAKKHTNRWILTEKVRHLYDEVLKIKEGKTNA